MESLPSFDDLPTDGGARNAWGVWSDPRIGALELLTAERALSASKLIRRGAVFPLDAALDELEKPLFGRESLQHETSGAGDRSMNDHIHRWNTQASSQWDGFKHINDPVMGLLGGLSHEEHGVDHWARRGMVGRGVLADVDRWRDSVGRPLAFNERDVIEPDELELTLKSQGVESEPGDLLLIHTGWIDKYRALDEGAKAKVSEEPGLPGILNTEAMARVLWNLHVSGVASDNPSLEAWPPRGDFLHFWLLDRLGIPIGELWDLGRLAADCASDGVYEFFLVSAPLHLRGGVATPPNAVAIK